MIKQISTKWAVIVGAIAVTLLALIPISAWAVDYPGVGDDEASVGGSVSTEVGLWADESEISFSAPAVINFAMKGDGEFVYPTAGAAKIKNNSIFDIKVKQYVITNDADAHGMADISTAGSTANAYQLKVKPGTGANYDFATAGTVTCGNTDWTIGHVEGSNSLGLTFSNGKMVNATSIWGDTGHHLQDVVWTVQAA